MAKEPLYIPTLGANASKPDIRDYRIDTSEMTTFPKEFKLYMPPVKNQGKVGSCVAHALSTLVEYFNTIQHNNETQMSVGYIYGNRASANSKTSGMVTRTAIARLCSEGDVYHTDFPFNEEVPEIYNILQPKLDELRPKAIPFSFKAYFSVKTESEIKTALMKNGPVIIAVDWQKDMKVRDGVITSAFKEKDGGHCMILYGWNEKGWLIQNSWGRLWGDGGRAIWPYEYKIREAYSVVDKNTEEELKLKKPYQAKTKFGKWLIRIINYIYAVGYSIYYKVKYVDED